MADINVSMTSTKGVRLNTKNTICKDDIVVTPNLQTSAKTTTVNGVVKPDSGKYLSQVTVNVPPKPVDVATANEMIALLTSDNVGNVYRYTGTTTSSFTKGDLYEVQES